MDEVSREDTGQFVERRSGNHPAVSLDVIAYQVGQLQSALAAGLGSVEKTIEREVGHLSGRLEKIESAQREHELKYERTIGRLAALEEFRQEVDDRHEADTRARLAKADSESDLSFNAKVIRAVILSTTAILTLVALVIAVVQGLL